MILIALAIGVVLIVAALRNSQGALATALIADVPAFVVWGAALLAIGGIGFVPGLKPVSRGLLALVLVVLILHNWSAIQSGFLAASANTSTDATNKAAGIGAAAGAGVATPSGSSSGGDVISQLLDVFGGSGGSGAGGAGGAGIGSQLGSLAGAGGAGG
jgi:hypothetical protein